MLNAVKKKKKKIKSSSKMYALKVKAVIYRTRKKEHKEFRSK